MTALSSLVGYILNDADTGAQDESLLELGRSVVDVTCDALLWEFGAGASRCDLFGGASRRNGQSALIRPPQRWREVLINPEFLGAVFRTYAAVGLVID